MFIKGTPNMGISNLWPELHRYEWEGELMQFRRQRVAIDMTCMMRNALHGCVTVKSAAVVKYMSSKFADSDDSDFANSSSTINAREENALSSESPSLDSRTSTGAELPPMRSIVLFDEAHLLSVVKTKMSSIHNCGVFEVCVFDGCAAPMKSWKHQERAHKRRVAYENGMAKLEELYLLERRRLDEKIELCAQITSDLNLEEGAVKQRVTHVVLPQKHELFKEAMKFFEKALYISPELTQTVIEPLKERTVECIVAPYEAAAQMAYLCREGYVDAVLSEDSDLIAYGCPCIITKAHLINRKCKVLHFTEYASHLFRTLANVPVVDDVCNYSGAAAADDSTTTTTTTTTTMSTTTAVAAVEETAEMWKVSESLRDDLFKAVYDPESLQEPFALHVVMPDHDFPYEVFVLACVVAGCDYVAGLPNIEIRKAFQLVARAASLDDLFAALQRESRVSDETMARYRQKVLDAYYCFAHQLVYSPPLKLICALNPPPVVWGATQNPLKTHLLGERWGAQTARDVCVRHIKDPRTLQPYRSRDWKFHETAF